MSRYLKMYPISWPTFSVKYYSQDEDGWWNPKPRKVKKTDE